MRGVVLHHYTLQFWNPLETRTLEGLRGSWDIIIVILKSSLTQIEPFICQALISLIPSLTLRAKHPFSSPTL